MVGLAGLDLYYTSKGANGRGCRHLSLWAVAWQNLAVGFGVFRSTPTAARREGASYQREENLHLFKSRIDEHPILSSGEGQTTDAINERPTRIQGWECPLKHWGLVNETSGEIIELDCKSWKCLVHAPKMMWRWRTRIDWSGPFTLMLTITLVPEQKEPRQEAWRKLARYLKQAGVIHSIRVVELGHNTGMRHWHVLIGPVKRIEKKLLNEMVLASGLGEVCWISRIKDARHARNYVLKYLCKDLNAGSVYRKERRIQANRAVVSWRSIVETVNGRLDDRGVERTEPAAWALWKGEMAP